MAPRADVGGGTLAGIALAALGALLAHAGVVDFAGLAAFFGAILLFFAGYIPVRLKSLYVAAAAFVATAIAYFVAPLVGLPQDVTALSVAFVAFVQAGVTFIAQARNPDAPAAGP